jgi:L-cysteine:1D-myo-inositol 2-amino-2-deoxy-alpha-D-glucopyranoside ligase
LELYNELSRTVETFRPLTDTATIYVCGITPYDTTHLGHAFTYLSYDVLIRYLEYQGYYVRYVQNVTDIDDDIIRKGREVGENWLALGNRWTRHFIEDLTRLNVRPPDVYPRATDVISQMFEAIQTLIAKGHAYEANGNVYYAVASNPNFGKVSGLTAEEWLPIANERGNVPNDPNKRAPLDFVLWQAAKPGEPTWESPWGKGRPGWHIECSTMARTYLGDIIDVHGGGSDLQFPHHECETAQACGVTGQNVFARFWMHTAMVRYQGEKMSKSLGNLIWARDLMEQYNEDTVRILLSRHPYHQVWEYDAAELAPAQARAQRLLDALAAQGGDGVPVPVARSVSEFEAAMDDNLATSRALDVLDGMALAIQRAAAANRNVSGAQQTLRKLSSVFGLRLGSAIELRVQQGWDAHYQRFI